MRADVRAWRDPERNAPLLSWVETSFQHSSTNHSFATVSWLWPRDWWIPTVQRDMSRNPRVVTTLNHQYTLLWNCIKLPFVLMLMESTFCPDTLAINRDILKRKGVLLSSHTSNFIATLGAFYQVTQVTLHWAAIGQVGEWWRGNECRCLHIPPDAHFFTTGSTMYVWANVIPRHFHSRWWTWSPTTSRHYLETCSKRLC